MNAANDVSPNGKPRILHYCKREVLRPLRDQILRVSGFEVDSTLHIKEALALFERRSHPYDLVLVDVEGTSGIPEAENLCSEIKTARPGQLVSFVCNWRVAILTDCPDEILRTEFNPAEFVAGVRAMLTPQPEDRSRGQRAEKGLPGPQTRSSSEPSKSR